jgi:uncharacterized protein (DUF58 family)
MQGACHLGQGDETTEEYGITIAASLARKYLDSGLRVGVTASCEPSYLLPPGRGEDHLWRILETFALMKANGRVALEQLILSQMHHFMDGTAIIIVTPAITQGTIDALRHLKNQADSVTVILLDTASFGSELDDKQSSRNLTMIGVQLYLVTKGDDLSRTLDHRYSLLQGKFI